MEKDKKIMYDAWIEDIIDEVKNKSGDYWQKYFENPFYRGVLKRLVKDTRMVKGDQYHDQHQLKFDGINYEDFDHNKFHILLYTLYGLDGDQWGHLHTTYLFILKHIKDTQGEDNILSESKDNTTKFVEKIAKEIIGASTLSGKLLYFYPPVVEESKDEGPISADVNSEWIHNDRSTGIYHLTTDIRRIGRLYINKIMGPGIDREDPIFKQVNDIVIDNILKRARNHDWMKEVGGMRDLRDKHGFLRESKEDKSKNYREKVYRDLVKKTKWRDDSYREIDVDGVCNKINSYIEWGSSGAYFYVIPPCIEDLLMNVYGLTYSEMDRFFWDWYGEHIIYMLISKKEYLPPHIKRLNLSYLNESKEDKQKEYLTKVVDSIVKNSIVDRRSDVAFHKKGMIFFPWFNFPLSIEDDLKSFFESSLPHKQRPNFAQYCRDNFGLTNEEIKIVLDELELIIKDEIEDVLKLPMSKWNRLYESKDARQGEFLNYVLEDLMNNTTWKDASYTILLLHGKNISTSINYDTFSIDWIPSKVDEMFTNMGLDDGEKRMIWEIYKEFVLDKMISEGNNTWRKKHLHMRRYPYINESVDSVDKNNPYLDKVVDKLKHYTTFAASKSHVYRPFYTAQIPFTGGQKWYIEWFSNSLETGYGFKDGFKKEMRDIYGLTPLEIEYVYMKFTSYLIKEFEGRYTKVHVVKDQ